jgi:hypothetical protein
MLHAATDPLLACVTQLHPVDDARLQVCFSGLPFLAIYGLGLGVVCHLLMTHQDGLTLHICMYAGLSVLHVGLCYLIEASAQGLKVVVLVWQGGCCVSAALLCPLLLSSSAAIATAAVSCGVLCAGGCGVV